MKRTLMFLSVVLFIVSAWQYWLYYSGLQVAPVVIKEIAILTPTAIKDETPTPTITEDKTLSVEIVQTPTPDPIYINNFVLDNSVDLSSGDPVSLLIQMPNGEYLPSSTWASPISFYKEMDVDREFAPELGTTLIYEGNGLGYGNVPIWLAHSGDSAGTPLFASNLEFYLKVKEIGKEKYTVAESQSLLAGLIGQVATVCQDLSDEIKPLQTFDLDDPSCKGGVVDLEIVGGAIVLHEDLPEFLKHTLDMHDYLLRRYPEAGFEKINSKTGMLFVICLSRLQDQPKVGTAYDYNRVILVFRVIPRGSQ